MGNIFNHSNGDKVTKGAWHLYVHTNNDCYREDGFSFANYAEAFAECNKCCADWYDNLTFSGDADAWYELRWNQLNNSWPRGIVLAQALKENYTFTQDQATDILNGHCKPMQVRRAYNTSVPPMVPFSGRTENERLAAESIVDHLVIAWQHRKCK